MLIEVGHEERHFLEIHELQRISQELAKRPGLLGCHTFLQDSIGEEFKEPELVRLLGFSHIKYAMVLVIAISEELGHRLE